MEKSTPLDDAIRSHAASLAASTSQLPKHEPSESDLHRTAQRTHMQQWASPPLPDPVTRSFNRRTAAFVGIAIRQMAKQAYDYKAEIEVDSEEESGGNIPLPFEAAMIRQSEVRRQLMRIKRGLPDFGYYEGSRFSSSPSRPILV